MRRHAKRASARVSTVSHDVTAVKAVVMVDSVPNSETYASIVKRSKLNVVPLRQIAPSSALAGYANDSSSSPAPPTKPQAQPDKHGTGMIWIGGRRFKMNRYERRLLARADLATNWKVMRDVGPGVSSLVYISSHKRSDVNPVWRQRAVQAEENSRRGLEAPTTQRRAKKKDHFAADWYAPSAKAPQPKKPKREKLVKTRTTVETNRNVAPKHRVVEKTPTAQQTRQFLDKWKREGSTVKVEFVRLDGDEVAVQRAAKIADRAVRMAKAALKPAILVPGPVVVVKPTTTVKKAAIYDDDVGLGHVQVDRGNYIPRSKQGVAGPVGVPGVSGSAGMTFADMCVIPSVSRPQHKIDLTESGDIEPNPGPETSGYVEAVTTLERVAYPLAYLKVTGVEELITVHADSFVETESFGCLVARKLVDWRDNVISPVWQRGGQWGFRQGHTIPITDAQRIELADKQLVQVEEPFPLILTANRDWVPATVGPWTCHVTFRRQGKRLPTAHISAFDLDGAVNATTRPRVIPAIEPTEAERVWLEGVRQYEVVSPTSTIRPVVQSVCAAPPAPAKFASIGTNPNTNNGPVIRAQAKQVEREVMDALQAEFGGVSKHVPLADGGGESPLVGGGAPGDVPGTITARAGCVPVSVAVGCDTPDQPSILTIHKSGWPVFASLLATCILIGLIYISAGRIPALFQPLVIGSLLWCAPKMFRKIEPLVVEYMDFDDVSYKILDPNYTPVRSDGRTAVIVFLVNRLVSGSISVVRINNTLQEIWGSNRTTNAHEYRTIFEHPSDWTTGSQDAWYNSVRVEVKHQLLKHYFWQPVADGAHSGSWVLRHTPRGRRTMSLIVLGILAAGLMCQIAPQAVDILTNSDLYCPEQRWRDRAMGVANWSIDLIDIKYTLGIIPAERPSLLCRLQSCVPNADWTYCPIRWWGPPIIEPILLRTRLSNAAAWARSVIFPRWPKNAEWQQYAGHTTMYGSWWFALTFDTGAIMNVVVSPVFEEFIRYCSLPLSLLIAGVEYGVNTMRGFDAAPAFVLHLILSLITYLTATASGLNRVRIFAALCCIHIAFNVTITCGALVSVPSCASIYGAISYSRGQANVIGIHGTEHMLEPVDFFPITVEHTTPRREPEPRMWVIAELYRVPYTYLHHSVANLIKGLIHRVYTTPDPTAPDGVVPLPVAQHAHPNELCELFFAHFQWFKEASWDKYISDSKSPRATREAVFGAQGADGMLAGELTNRNPSMMGKIETTKLKVGDDGQLVPGPTRIIMFQNVVENAVVGRFFGPATKMIYAAMDSFFASCSGLDTVTVVSGYNNDQQAQSIVNLWEALSKRGRPVLILSDLVKFDASCGPWVRWLVLKTYRRALRFCRNKVNPFAIMGYLVRAIQKKLTARLPDGRVTAKVVACTASGYSDTSASSRIIVPLTTIEALWHKIDVFGAVNQGDDQITGVLEQDVDRASQLLIDQFGAYGMTLEIEALVYDLNKVEFCQQVLLTGEGVRPRLCCNMSRIDKCAFSSEDITTPQAFYNRLYTLGLCNLACYAGLPVMDAFFTMLLRSGRAGFGAYDSAHLTWVQKQLVDNPSTNDGNVEAYRQAFTTATGVSLLRQLQLEDMFDDMQIQYQGAYNLPVGVAIQDVLAAAY